MATALMLSLRLAAGIPEDSKDCEGRLTMSESFPSGFAKGTLEFDGAGPLLALDEFLSSKRRILWELSRQRDLPGYIRHLHEVMEALDLWVSMHSPVDLSKEYSCLIYQHDASLIFMTECLFDRMGEVPIAPEFVRELLLIRETRIPGSSWSHALGEIILNRPNFSAVCQDLKLRQKIASENLLARIRLRKSRCPVRPPLNP